ncbi:phosphohydrolase [Blastopirellula marina]|uniref:Phosphohydrolase n=1 Tax=Blastopirellula marina TaxID=124 RepID=A0A2S8G3Z7_9BACT|nr:MULTISPECIES: AAA family ATPase [Pirellulaceae]PQO39175.1 phosphohydrolase [Blastopirellula marina]RCS55483.1 HD domain-containing protein [Bremerella cremea]
MNWTQLATASIHELIAWAQPQPWCQAMAACAQDAQWHSEGDVWTHTKLVLHELKSLEEWPSLSSHEQTILKFTALFHDIAKPLTTEIDSITGRVTSPKHAVKGEHLARNILRDLGCSLTTREEIARMVRYHGRPVFLLEKPEPIHEVIRHSWLLHNRLLYLFALADTRGRDTDSMTRPEENLHFWKVAAEETDCFDRPYAFASDHARFTFFHTSQPNLHYQPHEEFSCQATLMCGLPGAGKDTWLARHRSDSPIVSLDDIRAEMDVAPTENQGQVAQLAQERCRELLRSGTSFALNATNTMHQTRSRWLNLFADYDARIEIVYLEPSLDDLLQQNKKRSNRVPEAVIEKLASRCQVPTWLECHTLISDAEPIQVT